MSGRPDPRFARIAALETEVASATGSESAAADSTEAPTASPPTTVATTEPFLLEGAEGKHLSYSSLFQCERCF